jgi:Zn-dependent M28 family amino/carboxypeptidase
VTINPGIDIHRVTVPNVLGTLDPGGASEELVVVGAHLDHDGVHEDGRVYNGADDNASGTAAVLAMAAAFTKASATGQRPRRRVVFALWNAEEKGSLGAEAYLAPLPPGRVIANVNLDMIGRGEANGKTNAVHMLGYSYSPDFAALARRANEAVGLMVKEEYDGDAQNLIQRSDNWPFLKRGIPALFFTTGLHPDYHTPDDDTDRLDFAKLERITELASRLTWLVADGQPPRFKKQTR